MPATAGIQYSPVVRSSYSRDTVLTGLPAFAGNDNRMIRTGGSIRGDEARLGHELLMQGFVLLEELHHVLAGEEDRLERLLLHIVLVFRGLRDLLEQVDI